MATNNPYVNEHGLPRVLSAKERRRIDQLDADDAIRRERPNVDPDAEPHLRRFDRCPQSKYQTHRFAASGGRECEFCGRAWRDCLVSVREDASK